VLAEMKAELWTGKNVLVTGAGGFKGSHLVERLADMQANVVSLVRGFEPRSYFATRHLDGKCTVAIGDLKDRGKIADLLSKYEIATVFHLGAQPIETTALLNPLETLHTNIMGTVHVLEAARLYSRATGIVVVSSDKAYGPDGRLPFQESERLAGRTPYDVSKSCADLIAQVYADPEVYGMPITIARCANVFGPGDLNMNRIVPGILEAIVRRRPLRIRSNAELVREYVYVEDAVDGYIGLAEHIDATRGEAFNLASGNVMTVAEMVDRVCHILGKSIEIEVLDEARGEVRQQYLDGSKIREAIAWEVKTDFVRAVRETYAWYEQVLTGEIPPDRGPGTESEIRS
jgi:CDP-glucose 4,6-dehydratase